MRRPLKPPKTLEFCQVRRVAQGYFVILLARARMGNNINTPRNPAHSVEMAAVAGQKFATRSHLRTDRFELSPSCCCVRERTSDLRDSQHAIAVRPLPAFEPNPSSNQHQK